MAQAKRKNTTKRPAQPTASQLYKGALGRMEQIIATLESCFVTEGWHESLESGPMPIMAAEVMAYFHARADGARENATEEAKVNVFVANCGQSLDWIFGGDPRGLICKAAGNSPQSAGLAKPSAGTGGDKAQEISSGLSQFETPFLQVRNLALAARMMGSSDDMPREPGLALDAVADKIVTMMDELTEERTRLWRLSRDVAFPE